MRTYADNVCSGPAGVRTQVLNTSILEIYTAFALMFLPSVSRSQENHAYVSFISARCKKGVNCNQMMSTIQFYPKLTKGSINLT